LKIIIFFLIIFSIGTFAGDFDSSWMRIEPSGYNPSFADNIDNLAKFKKHIQELTKEADVVAILKPTHIRIVECVKDECQDGNSDSIYYKAKVIKVLKGKYTKKEMVFVKYMNGDVIPTNNRVYFLNKGEEGYGSHMFYSYPAEKIILDCFKK